MKIFKIIILAFLFISSLKAEYLLLTTEFKDSAWGSSKEFTFSRCIKDYYYNSSYLHYIKASNGNEYVRELENIKDIDIQSGYIYHNGKCIRYEENLQDTGIVTSTSLNAKNLSLLGLKDSQLNFLFSISGLIVGSFFILALFRTI